MAVPCKADRTMGCNYFAPLRSHSLSLQQKLAMPLQPHKPPLFCPLSPEAYLLRGKALWLLVKQERQPVIRLPFLLCFSSPLERGHASLSGGGVCLCKRNSTPLPPLQRGFTHNPSFFIYYQPAFCLIMPLLRSISFWGTAQTPFTAGLKLRTGHITEPV